jgi:hypothetical protein
MSSEAIAFGQHGLQQDPQFFGAGHRFLQLVEKQAAVSHVVKYHDITASSSRAREELYGVFAYPRRKVQFRSHRF